MKVKIRLRSQIRLRMTIMADMVCKKTWYHAFFGNVCCLRLKEHEGECEAMGWIKREYSVRYRRTVLKVVIRG
jgi:hypothetical protein